ncbi:ATP-dependent DNA ligase [Sphingomonas oligophenolica]|uniref:DNA ligase (ATP) n=1 Tax=Sphingomonas oligophenolica TaxID=301154 RepID=A0ABU9Y0P3_9SPHN
MIDALVKPIAPMEARLVSALPEEPGWQFEPKWDGFRAIAVRDGERVAIWSKSGRPLDRYFPELVALLLGAASTRFIVDGEIVVPRGNALSFGALQARLHPAPSRIARLSRETPAQFMLFDLLRLGDEDVTSRPLAERRPALEAFHAAEGSAALLLSPCSHDLADARAWLAEAGGALDGVVAKRLDQPYLGGERAMAKVKQRRSADCVVGGFRRTPDGSGVASLLLGLYNDEGRLDHVGFTSGLAAAERKRLLGILAPLVEAPGFTGKAPGGPSRWNDGKESEWSPLRAECVVEVGYDQVTDGRFRHGTKLLRWRPDKRPDQCTTDQLVREISPAELITLMGAR